MCLDEISTFTDQDFNTTYIQILLRNKTPNKILNYTQNYQPIILVMGLCIQNGSCDSVTYQYWTIQTGIASLSLSFRKRYPVFEECQDKTSSKVRDNKT